MKRKEEGQLISASTILILSGFLIGLTVGKMVSESLSPYVLSCGLAGFIAFIALEFTGTQREENQAHEEQVHIQGRLDRHVMSLSSMSFTLPDSPAMAHRKNDLNQSSIDQAKLDELYARLMRIDQDSAEDAIRETREVEA